MWSEGHRRKLIDSFFPDPLKYSRGVRMLASGNGSSESLKSLRLFAAIVSARLRATSIAVSNAGSVFPTAGAPYSPRISAGIRME